MPSECHPSAASSPSQHLIGFGSRARARFGEIDAPVIDMTAERAVCAVPDAAHLLAADDTRAPAALSLSVSISLNGEPVNHVPCPANFTAYAIRLSAVAPYSGPTNGGTRVVVSGAGFHSLGADSGDGPAAGTLRDLGGGLYGRRALCRFAAAVVNATIEGDGRLRCVSPPSMAGPVRPMTRGNLFPTPPHDAYASAPPRMTRGSPRTSHIPDINHSISQ